MKNPGKKAPTVPARAPARERRASSAPAPGANAAAFGSRGHQLLVGLPDSNGAIANRIGGARATVGAWRRGEKLPSAEARRKLATAFPGIPAAAWSEKSAAPAQGASEAPEEVAAQPHRSLGEVEDLLRAVRSLRKEPALLPAERLKAVGEERALLRARMLLLREEQRTEEITLARILSSADWARIQDCVFGVLVAKHPAAAREVAEALQAIRGRA